MRILAKIMTNERGEKLEKIEKLNKLLNPQKYVAYKKELEEKEKYLSLVENDDIEKEINKLKLELQKIVLKCFDKKLKKCTSKQEMLKLIYEYRYYMMLPYDNKKYIYEEKDLQKEIKEETKNVLERAYRLKVIQKFSKQG